MSYRQSRYDPLANEMPGPPLRPYNWVQWAGVACEVVAILLFIVWGAGKLGWIAPLLDRPLPAVAFGALGTILVGSRRGPGIQVGSEQYARNRKWLVATTAVLTVFFAILVVIEFKGAN
jgi:hypothetical protein